ncbi:MAG: valine--tRNA ligase [Ignavibacteria bacterium]|nr:valine--tRNA ligase [Ignavibacteria bacterium]
MNNLEKIYSPNSVQDKWYESWNSNGLFSSSPSQKAPYSILMPPPNVTGILHFGHILNNTLQDIYIRWNRLKGNEACWFPGIDHAGIATQTKVEQELKKEGISRRDIGREAFVDRVWEWKEKYGGIIFQQQRTLGVSADWERTLFTMDNSAVAAVREVFIQLFDEGLIYKGKGIINWSPVAQSALSDEEVIFKEVKEHFYTMRYHLEDGSGTLMVGTVRPETIFADVAVAVNPADERYKHLIGTNVIVPLGGQVVPIIADDYADPTFGTGCVKVTPAHDPNDYQIGIRHGLAMPQCINADATLNEICGVFAGLDRFVARRKIVAALEAAELLEKTEDYVHNVGFSERGEEAIEPYLSDQWFVKMKPLTGPALDVVRSGEVKFYPEHWTKTYEHWMGNIRDWCISRQLWWGHRIPVFYAENGQFTAARNEAEARVKLGLPDGENLVQDPDVLDTWFSSWLWPLTTMGWSGEKPGEASAESEALMNYYLPTDLLVTGPDIIFFWVARMIMATKKFRDTVPFKAVYFTSIIRDGRGRKLSKSLGNSPDPLDVIEKYGADAVRFTMIHMAPMGSDVRLDINVETQDIASMELGRNFANKIWNACRFLQMKQDEIGDVTEGVSEFQHTTADKWIRSRYESTVAQASEALNNFRITEYARALYDFVWRDFCDWYVEIVKVQFAANQNAQYRKQLLDNAFGIIKGMLTLIHPVMPFLTEELWHELYDKSSAESIGTTAAPVSNSALIDSDIESKFELTQLLVEAVRRQRNEMNIPPSEKLPITVSAPEPLVEFFQEQKNVLQSLGRSNSVTIGSNVARPQGSVADVVRGIEFYLEVSSAVDMNKERERLQKEYVRLQGAIKGIEKKLSNEGFVKGANPDVVEQERKKLADWTETMEKIDKNLESINN